MSKKLVVGVLIVVVMIIIYYCQMEGYIGFDNSQLWHPGDSRLYPTVPILGIKGHIGGFGPY